MPNDPPLHLDLMRGASEMALFVYGDDSPPNCRRIYRLVETRQLPVFRMGDTICGRKSTFLAHFAAQERTALQSTEAA